jgi:glutamine synthetase
MLEKFYQNKRNILKKSQEFFQNSNSLIPKIGCELEFFLLEKNLQAVENTALIVSFITDLQSALSKNYPLIYQVEKEQGASQIEVKTSFTADLLKLCEELENAKIFIQNFAKERNFIASFAAQPFAQDCGNALQFNLSLHDENDENIFNSDQKLLAETASNLLCHSNSMMIFLAPNEEDYSRFSSELNRNLFKRGKFTAPINLSFGADNRTCAIRVPAPRREGGGAYTRKLEYRLACANADSFLVIATILIAISTKEKNQKFEQIFGNAFDAQYSLEEFCKSLKKAEEVFFAENCFVREKLQSF